MLDVGLRHAQRRIDLQHVVVGTAQAHHDVLKINPPLCVTEADIERLAGALEQVLSAS